MKNKKLIDKIEIAKNNIDKETTCIEEYNYQEITLDKINRIEIFYYSMGKI